MTLPPHAPYEVDPGHPVEIRVFEREGSLIAECEVGGDKFGGSTELPPEGLDRIVAVDELVQATASLVYHELLGDPVFRDEDEQWVERVASRAPWQTEARHPTLGYVVYESAEEPDEASLAPEPEHHEDPIAATLGDADVSDLQLSQEDMAALTRGEVPPSLIARVLRSRSTENLLDSAIAAVEAEIETFPDADGTTLARALSELAEVRRRFDGE